MELDEAEAANSIQKIVAEGGKIYFSSRQSIKHQAIPGQNLLEAGNNWEVSADLPGVMITRK